MERRVLLQFPRILLYAADGRTAGSQRTSDGGAQAQSRYAETQSDFYTKESIKLHKQGSIFCPSKGKRTMPNGRLNALKDN